MKKRILSILMVLCMVLTLLPAMTLGAAAETETESFWSAKGGGMDYENDPWVESLNKVGSNYGWWLEGYEGERSTAVYDAASGYTGTIIQRDKGGNAVDDGVTAPAYTDLYVKVVKTGETQEIDYSKYIFQWEERVPLSSGEIGWQQLSYIGGDKVEIDGNNVLAFNATYPDWNTWTLRCNVYDDRSNLICIAGFVSEDNCFKLKVNEPTNGVVP